MLNDAKEVIHDSLKFADNSFESRDELRQTAKDVHAADMMSDNRLSKLIRPIITLVLLFFHVVMLVASMFGIQIHNHVLDQNSLMLGAAITFYFGSKAWERVTEKRVMSDVKQQQDRNKAILKEKEMILKQDLKERKADHKTEVKAERRESRRPLFKRRN